MLPRVPENRGAARDGLPLTGFPGADRPAASMWTGRKDRAPGLFRSESVRDLQEWARRFDLERGWDAVSPGDTSVHLMEEAGEVARAILMLGGYKRARGGRDDVKRELSHELADIVFLCSKLANQYGLDLARAIGEKVAENERRFPTSLGRKELGRYLSAKRREWRRLASAGSRSGGKDRRHLTF